GWIKGDAVYPLDMSKTEAKRLLDKIAAIFNKYYIDQQTKQLKTPSGEDRIDGHELALVRTLLEKFEAAFAAELNFAPVYMAQKCGIYSTFELIEHASYCFDEETRKSIPAVALREFDEAGRALVYGLGSAAGMHLLRAVEVVLKTYYESFTGSTVNKNERSYAIYLKKLASLSEEEKICKPNKRLLQMLAQIKEQYRNPLVSPESEITMPQAFALFNLAMAAIPLMLEQVFENGSSDKEKALQEVTKLASVDEVEDEDETSPAQESQKKAG
ncbi:MAG: hypothetical protein AB7S81_08225, partial [Bdellovibrionales bacterium]